MDWKRLKDLGDKLFGGPQRDFEAEMAEADAAFAAFIEDMQNVALVALIDDIAEAFHIHSEHESMVTILKAVEQAEDVDLLEFLGTTMRRCESHNISDQISKFLDEHADLFNANTGFKNHVLDFLSSRLAFDFEERLACASEAIAAAKQAADPGALYYNNFEYDISVPSMSLDLITESQLAEALLELLEARFEVEPQYRSGMRALFTNNHRKKGLARSLSTLFRKTENFSELRAQLAEKLGIEEGSHDYKRLNRLGMVLAENMGPVFTQLLACEGLTIKQAFGDKLDEALGRHRDLIREGFQTSHFKDLLKPEPAPVRLARKARLDRAARAKTRKTTERKVPEKAPRDESITPEEKLASFRALAEEVGAVNETLDARIIAERDRSAQLAAEIAAKKDAVRELSDFYSLAAEVVRELSDPFKSAVGRLYDKTLLSIGFDTKDAARAFAVIADKPRFAKAVSHAEASHHAEKVIAEIVERLPDRLSAFAQATLPDVDGAVDVRNSLEVGQRSMVQNVRALSLLLAENFGQEAQLGAYETQRMELQGVNDNLTEQEGKMKLVIGAASGFG